MKLASIVLGIVVAAAPAHAAVSGFHDSAEQIGTILSSPEVADSLRQAPVDSISTTGAGADGLHEWRVRTRDCDLAVHLKPVPPKGIGKTTYLVDTVGECR